jgi:hypothetical protein
MKQTQTEKMIIITIIIDIIKNKRQNMHVERCGKTSGQKCHTKREKKGY